jgi:pimeloyl-ACP methyl ester carboxylesterase
MAHKFVPRKGFGRKDKDQAKEKEQAKDSEAAAESPQAENLPSSPPPIEEAEDPGPAPPPPPPSREAPDDDLPVRPRSAKDSILKKLPGRKGPRKSVPKIELPRKVAGPPAARVKEPKASDRGKFANLMVFGVCVVAFLVVGGGVWFLLLNQSPGYQSSVAVTAPTRLDWTYIETRRSLDKPPDNMAGYSSTRGTYELYVPPGEDPDTVFPVILFIPVDSRPNGWSAWKKVCVERKMIFISPAGAGDDQPVWVRTRAALDALDQVRREFKTDPDRTYIAGLLSGGYSACRIAFSLPELFGGVILFSSGDVIREEPWLQQRVADRLAVACVVGEEDASGTKEIRDLHLQTCKQFKVAAQEWVVPGLNRDLPDSDILGKTVDWLELSLTQRRKLAEQYPASRMPADKAWTPSEWADLLVREAEQRLKSPDGGVAGFAQLFGAINRWKGVPATARAAKLYRDFQLEPSLAEANKDRQDRNRRMAQVLTNYLVGLTPGEQMDNSRVSWRSDRFQHWVDLTSNLWKQIQTQTSSPDEVQRIHRTIEELDRLKLGLTIPKS